MGLRNKEIRENGAMSVDNFSKIFSFFFFPVKAEKMSGQLERIVGSSHFKMM